MGSLSQSWVVACRRHIDKLLQGGALIPSWFQTVCSQAQGKPVTSDSCPFVGHQRPGK